MQSKIVAKLEFRRKGADRRPALDSGALFLNPLMRPDRRPQLHQPLQRLKASFRQGGGEGERHGFHGDEGGGVQCHAFVFGAGQEEAGGGVFFKHAVFLPEQHDDRDVEAASLGYGGLGLAVGAAVQEHDEDVAVLELEQLFGEGDASGVERISADAGALEQPCGIGGDDAGGADAEHADAACLRKKPHSQGHGFAVFGA